MKPIRLGFSGLGIKGRKQLELISRSGLAEIVAVSDPSSEMISHAVQICPHVEIFTKYEQLLKSGLDGVVIASPSSIHAHQALLALERGISVFCQNPLGRNSAEVKILLDAARKSNQVLEMDLPYRTFSTSQRLRSLILEKAIGTVYGVELIYHHCSSQEKFKSYLTPGISGGCTLELGSHLLDLALWSLDFPEVQSISSQLYSHGRLLSRPAQESEDYALATLELLGGVSIRLACSWRLPSSYDTVIEATYYGTQGKLSLRNQNGSPYQFSLERISQNKREVLSELNHLDLAESSIRWIRRVQNQEHFDPDSKHYITLSRTLDAVYGKGSY